MIMKKTSKLLSALSSLLLAIALLTGTAALSVLWQDFSDFADKQLSFQADLLLCGGSLLAVAIILCLCRGKKLRLHRFFGHGIAFWTFLELLIFFAAVAAWGVTDFSSLRAVLSRIPFLGGERFISPNDFWLRAAAPIGGISLGVSALLSLAEHFLLPRQAPTVFEELTELTR